MVSVNTIICPIDFSDFSHAALSHAETIARTFGAELIVAHIVEPVLYPVAYGLPVADPSFNLEEESRRGAQKALAPIVDDIASRGVDAKSLVSTGTASLKVCQLVEEHGIDLVVLSTHGLTGVKHMLMGSTAERVVRRCKVPVLTVKADVKTA